MTQTAECGAMVRTIGIGSNLQVQGDQVGALPDGRIVIRVGSREFTGFPIPVVRAA
ncbi:hypothetical protein [Tabrizicola soli]|uniref:Uncharacterized protein n=1 Tax=Tabrizicola soli TaxID=2185115 RepID=A0ABV7E058_9RHOB